MNCPHRLRRELRAYVTGGQDSSTQWTSNNHSERIIFIVMHTPPVPELDWITRKNSAEQQLPELGRLCRIILFQPKS